MEFRDANLIVSNAGGTAGKNSKTYKLALPNSWVHSLGLSNDNRRVELVFDGDTITIKRPSTVKLFLEEKQERGHKLYALRYYGDTELCSLIYADFTDHTIAVENYALSPRKTAFGNNAHPDWTDFEEFLESRCIPRNRQSVREYLEQLGLYEYDPFEIIKKTNGFMAEDHQWIEMEEL